MIGYLEPNVVIVDDVRTEIEGVFQYFSELGVGCKIFNANLYDGDEFPQTPFSDTTMVFLDLHYSDKFDAELCASWLRHVIRPKSFYILVMWTKDVAKGEEVLAQLKVHNVTPFFTLTKNKSDFRTEGNKFNFNALIEGVMKELTETPALEEILTWKKSVKYSSNEILGNITKDPNKFVNKLKKLIISHGGTSIKDDENPIHKRMALFDALDTALVSNTKKNIDTEITELNLNTLYDLNTVENEDSDKELNSWFHFKIGDNIADGLITPGLIAKNDSKFFKKLYSIQDDPKVSKLLVNQQGENIILLDIVMLLSRPCDIAQMKYGKNLKLLSGILIQNPNRKKNKVHLVEKLDCLKVYDHLYLSEAIDDAALIFDFRYSFSVPKDLFISKFKNIKIFSKELLSEIQVEYSSYSSRLGITQII